MDIKYITLALIPVFASLTAVTPEYAVHRDVRPAFLQTTRIIGRITDESSRPVANAAVLIAGSERGTVTNLAGGFEIADAPVAGMLIVKHPDFETRQLPIVKATPEYVIILKSRPRLAAMRSKNTSKPLINDTELNQPADYNSAMRPDRWPHFPGGYKGLNKFLANNLKYPENAIEAGIQGAVQVSFLLDEDGNVSSGRIIKSPGAELEEEALRLVGAMPRWTPAQKEGKPIAVWYTISIQFDPEVEKLPLRIREEIPKLFSRKIKLEPLKSLLPSKDEFLKIFRYPAMGLSAHQPAQTNLRINGYGLVKKPVYVPLKLNFRPEP